MASRRRKCSAKAKTTGKRCKAWAITGGTVCVKHGGAAPQVKRKAKRRVADEKARKALYLLGRPRELDPHEALLEEVHRTAGHVATLELLIAEFKKVDELVDGTTRTVSTPDGDTVTVQTAVSVWVSLYQAERRHLIFAARTAIVCGVEQARVELEERQGALIADVFRHVFADQALGLTGAQRRAAMVSAAGRLRVIAGGRDAA